MRVERKLLKNLLISPPSTSQGTISSEDYNKNLNKLIERPRTPDLVIISDDEEVNVLSKNAVLRKDIQSASGTMPTSNLVGPSIKTPKNLTRNRIKAYSQSGVPSTASNFDNPHLFDDSSRSSFGLEYVVCEPNLVSQTENLGSTTTVQNFDTEKNQIPYADPQGSDSLHLVKRIAQNLQKLGTSVNFLEAEPGSILDCQSVKENRQAMNNDANISSVKNSQLSPMTALPSMADLHPNSMDAPNLQQLGTSANFVEAEPGPILDCQSVRENRPATNNNANISSVENSQLAPITFVPSIADLLHSRFVDAQNLQQLGTSGNFLEAKQGPTLDYQPLTENRSAINNNANISSVEKSQLASITALPSFADSFSQTSMPPPPTGLFHNTRKRLPSFERRYESELDVQLDKNSDQINYPTGLAACAQESVDVTGKYPTRSGQTFESGESSEQNVSNSINYPNSQLRIQSGKNINAFSMDQESIASTQFALKTAPGCNAPSIQVTDLNENYSANQEVPLSYNTCQQTLNSNVPFDSRFEDTHCTAYNDGEHDVLPLNNKNKEITYHTSEIQLPKHIVEILFNAAKEAQEDEIVETISSSSSNMESPFDGFSDTGVQTINTEFSNHLRECPQMLDSQTRKGNVIASDTYTDGVLPFPNQPSVDQFSTENYLNQRSLENTAIAAENSIINSHYQLKPQHHGTRYEKLNSFPTNKEMENFSSHEDLTLHQPEIFQNFGRKSSDIAEDRNVCRNNISSHHSLCTQNYAGTRKIPSNHVDQGIYLNTEDLSRLNPSEVAQQESLCSHTVTNPMNSSNLITYEAYSSCPGAYSDIATNNILSENSFSDVNFQNTEFQNSPTEQRCEYGRTHVNSNIFCKRAHKSDPETREHSAYANRFTNSREAFLNNQGIDRRNYRKETISNIETNAINRSVLRRQNNPNQQFQPYQNARVNTSNTQRMNTLYDQNENNSTCSHSVPVSLNRCNSHEAIHCSRNDPPKQYPTSIVNPDNEEVPLENIYPAMYVNYSSAFNRNEGHAGPNLSQACTSNQNPPPNSNSDIQSLENMVKTVPSCEESFKEINRQLHNYSRKRHAQRANVNADSRNIHIPTENSFSQTLPYLPLRKFHPYKAPGYNAQVNSNKQIAPPLYENNFPPRPQQNTRYIPRIYKGISNNQLNTQNIIQEQNITANNSLGCPAGTTNPMPSNHVRNSFGDPSNWMGNKSATNYYENVTQIPSAEPSEEVVPMDADTGFHPEQQQEASITYSMVERNPISSRGNQFAGPTRQDFAKQVERMNETSSYNRQLATVRAIAAFDRKAYENFFDIVKTGIFPNRDKKMLRQMWRKALALNYRQKASSEQVGEVIRKTYSFDEIIQHNPPPQSIWN